MAKIYIPKQNLTQTIEPTGTQDAPLPEFPLEYTEGLDERQRITQFAGTNREEESIKRNQDALNQIISNPSQTKETFGNILPLSMALKGTAREIFRDNSLTGAIYADLSRKRVDPKEALTEEEFKSSPYYLDGMKFPPYPINYDEQKKMHDNMLERKEEADLAILSSPAQKVARFITGIGAGIIYDPVATIASGFTGSATKSVALAFLAGGIENVIFDEVINYVNEDRLALEGKVKSIKERNIERTQAFFFGGFVAGGVRKLQNIYADYQVKKGSGNLLDEVPSDTTSENPTQINTAEAITPQENKPNINFSDYYTSETVSEQVRRRNSTTLEDRENLIKLREEERRKTISEKGKIEKENLELKLRIKEQEFKNRSQRTDEQKFDKVQSVEQAKEMMYQATEMNHNRFSDVETNKGNIFNTTNQANNGIRLPETLPVQGLSVPNLNVKYKVLDLDTLIYSNSAIGQVNPNYPTQFNPNPRDSSYRKLVNSIGNDVNINNLIYNGGNISTGTPVITKNGVVIIGNTRSAGLNLAYERSKTDTYANELKTNFTQFDYDGINKPILVREIVDELSEADLMKLKSSENDISGYPATEAVKNDAKILEDSDISTLYRGGDIEALENKNFYLEFFGNLAEENLDNYISNGNLTLTGKQKLSDALNYSIYKNEDLLTGNRANLGDNFAENIADSLSEITPKIIQIKNLIKQNKIDANLDVSDNFSKAFNLIYASDREHLAYNLNNRVDIFGDAFTDATTETIIRSFFKNDGNLTSALSKNEISSFLNKYLDLVNNTRGSAVLSDLQLSKIEPKTLLKQAKSQKEIFVAVQDKPQIDVLPNNSTALNAKFSKEWKQEDASTWDFERSGVKEGYKKLSSITKRRIESEKQSRNLTKEEEIQFYKDEANLLNFSLFEVSAEEWRTAYPTLSKDGKNIRDYATTNELQVLDDMQSLNAKLMTEDIPLKERLDQISDFARKELERLNRENPEGTFRIDAFKRQQELEYAENVIKDPQLREDYLKIMNEEDDILKRINDYFTCRLK